MALVMAVAAWLVGFLTALDTSPPTAPIPADTEPPPNFALYEEVWGIVGREFYWEPADPRHRTYATIDGLLQSLDDPYASFLQPDEVEALAGGPGPEMVEGVGVWVEPGYSGALVISTVADSPAHRSGLQSGDVILEADDVTFDGVSREEVMDALGGEPGSSVVLTILRDGEPVFPVELVRDTFAAPDIEAASLPNDVGYLKIGQFSRSLPNELDTVLADFERAGPKALVIDLRDNPGGDLTSLRAAASRFVRGVLYYEILGEDRQPVTSVDDVNPYRLPARLVVIVNEGTASAAEAMALVLREKLDATLLGQRTFGKHTIQGIIPISDGSLLRLTVAEWQSPNGVSVDGGLVPDRSLEPDEDPLEVAGELAATRTAANG